jgi:hypothetical protein
LLRLTHAPRRNSQPSIDPNSIWALEPPPASAAELKRSAEEP